TLLSPSRMMASHGATPAAATRTSTSPAPGSGTGMSCTSTTSGPPDRSIRAAFIGFLLETAETMPSSGDRARRRRRTNGAAARQLGSRQRKGAWWVSVEKELRGAPCDDGARPWKRRIDGNDDSPAQSRDALQRRGLDDKLARVREAPSLQPHVEVPSSRRS